MSRNILQLLVCLLFVGRVVLFEICNNPIKYCSDYCCGTSSYQYCCSSCSSSIFYHSHCSSKVNMPVAIKKDDSVISVIMVVIVFVISVSVIVTICCGCCCGCCGGCCNNRTGIERSGRVIQTNQQNVTVVTTGAPNYQPGCPQPGYNTAYPAGAMPPPYPTNTNYGKPPKCNPGHMPEQKY